MYIHLFILEYFFNKYLVEKHLNMSGLEEFQPNNGHINSNEK
jgi:hypothetical protein